MKITVIPPSAEIMTPIAHIETFPQLLEQAGRTCYKSEEKMTADSHARFIRGIVRSGHHSVLEHCSITVRIVGDRSMSHQLVRHRIAAYSQESQRYCDYGKKGFQVVCPPKVQELEDVPLGEYEAEYEGHWWEIKQGPSRTNAISLWLNTVFETCTQYENLRQKGIPPEDARSVLPNALKTEIVTTFNLRQWRHVFQLRALDRHAQWQIRAIMLDLFNRFNVLLPMVFADLVEVPDAR